MTVIQAYPLKSLRMRGGLGPLQGEPATGVLTITLEEIDGGTRIRWEYVVGGYMRYEVDTIAKAVDGVMTEQLHGLRDHLGNVDTGVVSVGEQQWHHHRRTGDDRGEHVAQVGRVLFAERHPRVQAWAQPTDRRGDFPRVGRRPGIGTAVRGEDQRR